MCIIAVSLAKRRLHVYDRYVRVCMFLQDEENFLLDDIDTPAGVPGTVDVGESAKLAEASASGNSKQLDSQNLYEPRPAKLANS